MNRVFNLLNVKFIFKILALFAAIFLFGVTAAFTYKAYVDLIDFIKLEHTSLFIRIYLAYSVALFVAIATIIQSFPIIWNRLTYWGQSIDNLILRCFTNKKYFLDAIEEREKNLSTLINDANKELQSYSWNMLNTNNSEEDINDIKKKIQNLIDNQIKNAINECCHIDNIIKNNQAKDSINNEKKEKLSKQLNNFIINLTNILKYIHEIKRNVIDKN